MGCIDLPNIPLNNKVEATSVSIERSSDLPAAAAEGEYVLSFGDLFQVVRRRLWIILLVALGLTGAAVALSLMQTPTYEASIKILIGQERQSRSDAPRDDVMSLQNLTRTMVNAVNSRPIAEAVIDRLDLQTDPDSFLGNLSAEQINETQFIEVRYEDPSPEEAQQIANATGDVFSERVADASATASAVTATVWERAVVPDEPVSPKTLRNAFGALVLGLMLGTGLSFLLEFLDDSWRSPEEAERVSGVPTFGVIPEFKVLTG